MTAANLVIRPAEPKDLVALEDVESRSWDDSSSPGLSTEELSIDQNQPPVETWVADRGGEVLGFISLGRRTTRDANRHVAMIKSIMVRPQFRKQGIARALLEQAVTVSRDHGYRKLSIRVLSSNPVGIKLCTAVGFEEEARLKGEYEIEGQYVDDIMYSIWLAET